MAEKEVKEVELIPVGDGADPGPGSEGGGVEGGEEAAAPARVDEEEERGGEEERGEEERLGHADDDPDTGDGRRRETRAEKNERRRRARDRDRTEIRYLRARNEALERNASETAQRLDRIEKSGDDEKIGRIRSAIRNADATIVKLTAAGEEAQALEATSIKNNLQEQLDKETRKAADRETRRGAPIAEQPGQGEPQGGPEPLSTTARRNALAWQARNGWFNADNPGSDERVAHALDAAILAEGFDPEDPEYYRELDRRVAEYMPHRASKNARRTNGGDGEEREERGERDREERPKRDVPRFRVGGRERALKPNEVYLSRERRAALEEMGANDDPVLMKKYLKAFKKFDEEAARQKS